VLILFVFPVLAVLATLWGVYYSRQQLKEAKRIREENHKLFDDQRRKTMLGQGSALVLPKHSVLWLLDLSKAAPVNQADTH